MHMKMQQSSADARAHTRLAERAAPRRVPAQVLGRSLRLLSGWVLALGFLACARIPAPAAATTVAATIPAAAAPAPDASATPAPGDANLPRMIVHKDPNCGCCELWIEHVRAAGFAVDVRDEADMRPIKESLGVPAGKASCHTAEVGGYVIEGHVPAEDIKRLLAEHPDARGLTVPGMPAGSPGMELPSGKVQPYTVELITRAGSTEAFAAHGSPAP